MHYIKVIIDWNHLCYGFLESRELSKKKFFFFIICNHNTDTKNITYITTIIIQLLHNSH